MSRSAGCGGFCQIEKHVLRNFLKTSFLTIIKLVVDKKYMPQPEFLKFLINYNDFNLLLLFIDAIILIHGKCCKLFHHNSSSPKDDHNLIETNYRVEYLVSVPSTCYMYFVMCTAIKEGYKLTCRACYIKKGSMNDSLKREIC